MHDLRLLMVLLLAGGVSSGAFCAPFADGNDKTAGPASAATAQASASNVPAYVPPVMRKNEPDDVLVVRLPGPLRPAAPAVASVTQPVVPPPVAFGDDPDRPILHRADPAYPPEYGSESALFCQTQIGAWTVADAVALLGESKGHRVSFGDDGAEDGDIYAFSDPSSRYRELELDFERGTGTLRTVFAYPWKMTWQECRRLWGSHVSSTEAEKGRTFYSYLDRHLDVLVEATGRVISLGLY